MPDLPPEWTTVKLSDLACRLTRRNVEANDNVLTISARYGLVSQERYFNKRVASADLGNYFLLHRGDFAYNKSYSIGYPVGAIKRLDDDDRGVVSPLYICFELLHVARNSSEFLVHYFESGLLEPSLRAIAKEGARNHGLLNVSVADFFSVDITLPPATERQKIAAILSAVDDVIEKTETVIESLQTLKEAMMQELLTRGLPGRHARFRQTEIGEIPEDWEVVELQSLCSNLVDCLHSTPVYVDGGPCWAIRTADVVPGKLLLDRALRVSEATYETRIARLAPLPGDIFYSREGERFGIAAPVPQGARVCLAQRMMHLRARADVSSSFLTWLLNSPAVYAQALADVGGSTSPHVNIGSIRRFRVPQPSLEEQSRIAAAFDVCMGHESHLHAEAVAARTLKAALRAVLLTGELRVAADGGAG